MLNKDVFHSNPENSIWKNQGVAKVDGNKFIENLDELKFELQHFVCEGQYQKGLEKILSNFLGHLAQDEQKAVWISGFFGSGKSHLCKMLRALWENTELPDGLTARGAVNLPDDIKEHLRELDIAGRKSGGLVAVSGTLSAGNTAFIRRTLAELVFESRGLPADIPKGRFVLWLRREGLEADVRKKLESKGKQWATEVNNFRLSTTLHQAVAEAQPGLGKAENVRDLLKASYPSLGNNDISNDELKNVLMEVLAPGGTVPLTLIILDEMQQYIGEDGNRTSLVQEMTQLLVSSFKGKLLLVATGQNALTGTANLRKLMDRYTVSVDLQDADVDTVIRKTVLLKKTGNTELQTLLNDRLGELTRHLHGNTGYQWKHTDEDYLMADYPLLSTRRRVWEWVQRAMDGAGTNSQLRGQLRLVYEALQDYADKPLGEVVRGDYIFDKNSTGMLQASILSNELNNEIQSLLANPLPDEHLQGRLLAMVFILNRLAHLQQDDKKIPATEAVLTDLLLENLYGRADLESRITASLNKLVQRGLLQKIDDAFLIQTKEGNAWHQMFLQERNALANNAGMRDAQRQELVKTLFKSEIGNLVSLAMGETSQSRPVELGWGAQAPLSARGVAVWVQDGASVSEEQMLRTARSNRDGTLVYVYIPRETSGDLMNQIIDLAAARQTLQLKVGATGAEAEDARKAMQETESGAKKKAERIVRDMLSLASVWVSGGILSEGLSLRAKLEDACAKMLLRRYPDFAKGDHPGWSQVISLCKQGTANVCPVLAFNGDAIDHPVVKLILSQIGASSKWQTITSWFEENTYGWPLDTIEGALYLLWALNAIEIHLPPPGVAVIATTERRELRKASISTQVVVVSYEDKIKFRGIMQALDPKGPTVAGRELEQEAEGFAALLAQHAASGALAPAAAPEKFALLEEAKEKTPGSERLKFLADNAAPFKQIIASWIERRDRLQSRLRGWQALQTMLAHANGHTELNALKDLSAALYDNRLLLEQIDPVQPLLRQTGDAFRIQINQAWQLWQESFNREIALLGADPDWLSAGEESRSSLLAKQGIRVFHKPELGTDDKVLSSLQDVGLSTWQDQTDALSGRFAKLRSELVQARQPKARSLAMKRAVIGNQAELESYLENLRNEVEPALAHGPVILE